MRLTESKIEKGLRLSLGVVLLIITLMIISLYFTVYINVTGSRQIDEFIADFRAIELEVLGRSTNARVLVIDTRNDDNSMNIASCYSHKFGIYAIILINKAVYYRQPDIERRTVIYHELLHCVNGSGHHKDTIMNATVMHYSSHYEVNQNLKDFLEYGYKD